MGYTLRQVIAVRVRVGEIPLPYDPWAQPVLQSWLSRKVGTVSCEGRSTLPQRI
jgi:hypothetical protein